MAIKKELWSAIENSGCFKCPAYLTPISIEHALRRCYRKSLHPKCTSVTFAFSDLVWFDLFALSICDLWVTELRSLGKTVEIIWPRYRNVNDQLQVMWRSGASNTNRDDANVIQQFAMAVDARYPRTMPFFPLTAYTEAQLKAISSDLQDENRLQTRFSLIKESNIVRSGLIRDVILHELGDNITRHAKGRLAHIAMTQLAKSLPLIHSDSSGESPHEPMHSFVQKTGQKAILEIVIADKGPGIAKTIKDAYMADETIERKFDNPSECDLIEYAFEYGSSRRSLRERLSSLLTAMTSAHPNVPPTGLFVLKELVREYHGLLSVRSGSSVVCFDYFDPYARKGPIRSDMTPGWKNLSNFGGTQFHILLPINKPPSQVHRLKHDLSIASEHDVVDVYEYISLEDYFETPSTSTLEEDALALSGLLGHLDKIRSRCGAKRVAVLVDFAVQLTISTKTMHCLLSELAQRQTLDQVNIPVNVSEALLQHQPDESWEHSRGAERALLCFSSEWNMRLFGGNANARRELMQVLETGTYEGLSDSLAESNSHLVRYVGTSSTYCVRFTQTLVLKWYRKALARSIASALLSADNGYFEPKIKVLLLSEVYSEGYFEISRMLDNNLWRTRIVRWFMSELLLMECSFCIAIGSVARRICELAIRELNSFSGYKIECVFLETMSHGIVGLMPIVKEVPKGVKVSILADVMGTGSTITSVVQVLDQVNIVGVSTIVDARSSSVLPLIARGREIVVGSILQKQLRYWHHLPGAWSYSDVHQVDPKTHKLVRNKVDTLEAIWKRDSDHGARTLADFNLPHCLNTFFEDVVIACKVYHYGHFEAGHKHIIFLFDIMRTAELFASEMSESITQEVDRAQAKRTQLEQKNGKITHVLFPSFNPGVNLIADAVAKHFQNAKSVPICYEEFTSEYDQDTKSAITEEVIVLDDASETGDTLLRLIDIAERRGASRIYGFVVIRRGTDYIARRLSLIRQYGRSRVDVRYLTNAEVPSYTSGNCPLCDSLMTLQHIKGQVKTRQLLRVVDHHIIALGVHRVSQENAVAYSMCNSESPRYGYILRYRWLIERARKDPEARHNVSKLVSEFDDNPAACLTLFGVLAKERIFAHLDASGRSALLYKALVYHIQRACRHFLNKVAAISDDDLWSVLVVAEDICETIAVDSFADLIRRAKDHVNHLSTILVFSLSSKLCHKYPGIVYNALSSLRTELHSGPAYEVVEDALRYWNTELERHHDDPQQRLSIYKGLRGGVFHELDHFRSNLISAIDVLRGPDERFRTCWDLYSNEVTSLRVRVFDS